jgi:hypothetical protein
MVASPVLEPPGTTTSRLRRLLESAPPRRRLAIEAGIKRLAIHPRQRLGEWQYIELCASYIHTMVDTAYETARVGWRELRSVLGWWSVPREHVTALGGVLRPLIGSQRHGQHLLLGDELAEEIRKAAEDLGLYKPTPDDHLDWKPVSPLQKGSHLVCRCPFHEDRRPSMLLDRRRRRATCLACGTSHRLDPSSWRVSSPRNRADRPTPPPLSLPASTKGYQHTGTPTSWVICTLGIRGKRTATTEGDLLDALAESEAKAGTPQPMLGLLAFPKKTAPDRLVYLDQMVPTGWTNTGGRWKPTGHRAISTRFIVVDVDEIDLPNVLDARDGEMLAGAGGRLESWARDTPGLSGVVAVVQTSLHGVQVTFELSESHDPRWKRGPESEALHDLTDEAVLHHLDLAGYIGGHADRSARGIGRLIRRPGHRIDKGNQPWVAHLRYLSTRGNP